ncbi:hypothetical protein [Shewanella sp.]|uniref:hypothetical protein n=1 Tax=Shewanella sp. TaxID=50422 RepID=UPI0040473257
MPYRRKKFFKKRGKRFYGKKRYGKYNKTASTALAIAKSVKNMLNVEYKWIDAAIGIINCPAAGTMIGLNQVAQGDTEITRDGEQIKAVSLYIKAVLTINAAATASQIRVIIFKAPMLVTATTPTPADLLEAVTVISPLNRNVYKKYRIMYDKTFTLDSNGVQSRTIKYFKKFVNLKLRYQGGGALITDMRENALFCLVIGSEAVNEPTINIYSRIRFIDN